MQLPLRLLPTSKIRSVCYQIGGELSSFRLRAREAFPGLPCSGGREMPSALAQLEGGGFAQAPVSSRKGLGGPKAESSPGLSRKGPCWWSSAPLP